MAYFAQLDAASIVLEVLVIDDSALDGTQFPASEPIGQAYLADLGIEGNFLECSIDGAYRGCYPSPLWLWIPDTSRDDGGIFQAPETEETP